MTIKKIMFVTSVAMLTSVPALAETLNERVVKSIADKASFDRVFYTTMETVINRNPTMSFDPSGVGNQAVIDTNCGIGDNGDTYCRTSYELYDGTDKLT